MRLRVVFCLFGVVVAMGCTSKEKEIQRILDSPISYRSHVAPSADFHAYSTWDWVPAPPQTTTPNPRGNDPDIRAAIETEVAKHMEARGYSRASGGATLAVNYHVADRDIDSDFMKTMYDGTYYPEYRIGYSGPNKVRYQWQEGEVVVFIFDTSTREMVWQGSALAEVTLDAPVDKRLQRIDKAIKGMFTSFPGRPRVQTHESSGD